MISQKIFFFFKINNTINSTRKNGTITIIIYYYTIFCFTCLGARAPTYYSVKRDLLQCQKRPTTVSKETYYSVKRAWVHVH